MNQKYSRMGGALAAILLACSAMAAVTAQAEETEDPKTHGFVQHEDGTVSYMNQGVLQTGKFGAEKDFPLGDVDGNAGVSSMDAAVILAAAAAAGTGNQTAPAYLLEYNSSFTSQEEAALYADVNEDAAINASDAAEILQYAAAVGANAQATPLGFAYYFADENGILQTGAITDENGVQYYAQEDYKLHIGWLELDGKRYYYDDKGERLTAGFAEIAGQVYYITEDGSILCNSWLEQDGRKFYFDASGARVCAYQTIDDAVYYFSPDGAMHVGWLFFNDYTTYFGEDGVMATGWQTIDGAQYYFDESGVMLTDTTVDDLIIGSDGFVISQTVIDLKGQMQDILAKNGSTVNNIYDYMRSTNRYKKIESTKTLSQIEELGWTHFVNYSMSHYYVVCYYMAAKMDFMLREAGYECRVVYATHGTGDHYWNQVYIDGAWVNYDCTNGYRAYTLDQMIAKGDYKILDYLTPKYH